MLDRFMDKWFWEKPLWVGMTVIFGIIVLLMVGLIVGGLALGRAIDAPAIEDCRNKGGDPWYVGKGTLVCFEEGVIKK